LAISFVREKATLSEAARASLTGVHQALSAPLQPVPLRSCLGSAVNGRWDPHGRRLAAHAHFSAASHAVVSASSDLAAALARTVDRLVKFCCKGSLRNQFVSLPGTFSIQYALNPFGLTKKSPWPTGLLFSGSLTILIKTSGTTNDRQRQKNEALLKNLD
jgi:hypothetical protein